MRMSLHEALANDVDRTFQGDTYSKAVHVNPIYSATETREGLILLPEFKWSETFNLESLYRRTIVHDRSLRSLRDLTDAHLKLLRNIQCVFFLSFSKVSSSHLDVLNDLRVKRGLTEWRVVRNIRVSTDSDEAIDAIYGNVIAQTLQEKRINRRRKCKGGQIPHGNNELTWCCFVVLPTCSYSQTLSTKRLVEMQQCANANEPNAVSPTAKFLFLCLTDAATISYYVIQSGAVLP
ncbi:hypothetical protein PsorP6_008327 [Peronosclerospora sorghi]|uniref:Uncharacterized protein n=1 Tax=Peronosclerospora sorghi TaxID=230839 RepID=A0ACC0WBB0_9STRA|nr:hypothetical protein PsorP6_008327 [Peronosclerospora sorghi]